MIYISFPCLKTPDYFIYASDESLRGKVSVSLVGSWPKKCEECRKELTAGVHLKFQCGQMQAECLVLPVFFLWLVPTNPLKVSLEVRRPVWMWCS